MVLEISVHSCLDILHWALATYTSWQGYMERKLLILCWPGSRERVERVRWVGGCGGKDSTSLSKTCPHNQFSPTRHQLLMIPPSHNGTTDWCSNYNTLAFREHFRHTIAWSLIWVLLVSHSRHVTLVPTPICSEKVSEKCLGLMLSVLSFNFFSNFNAQWTCRSGSYGCCW
jgi:hypothetical protein